MEQDQVLSVYGALHDTGALKQLEEYRNKADRLQQLVNQSVELFTRRTEEDLVSYVVTSLLQAFVPRHVAVFLDPLEYKAPVKTLYYRNLKPEEPPVRLASIDWLEPVLETSQEAVSFTAVLAAAPREAEALRPLDPELVVPLLGLNGLYGVVVIGARILDDPYTEEELRYINQFFVFASIGLQNILHYVSAVTDYKTRLYNHSFFNQRLMEEIQKVRRYGARFALLEIDIDHFKRLNDTYGHLAGDEVLYQFSRILEKSVRTEDVVSRYGGEEFLALLVECPPRDTLAVAERIRRAAEERVFSFRGEDIRMTVSVGVTYSYCAGLEEPADVIARADFALYEAKERGRNQVRTCRPGLLGVARRRRLARQAEAGC
ncbi:hypothetical protein AU468_13680 [Alkalispirochaeta sphaeroplastigenens]|uniref:diguanylate cyclase n=1 Tax=Alkalispirochaeta sphaeroplastigenens TaxID=1187066 RepID=A0A2S4JG69_9SPIO|nr:GGDEF domain-containing protein [Alkalispirochaeta sphaeroplastigenens]POQ98400.1 hypothetical protein AU468_13680 [Alkalispirochaeta sphaeroplastigenens]